MDVEVVKSNHVLENEKSSLQSNFDLEIKDVSDVTTLVVEETESQKEPLLKVKPILEFVDVIAEGNTTWFATYEGYSTSIRPYTRFSFS